MVLYNLALEDVATESSEVVSAVRFNAAISGTASDVILPNSDVTTLLLPPAGNDLSPTVDIQGRVFQISGVFDSDSSTGSSSGDVDNFVTRLDDGEFLSGRAITGVSIDETNFTKNIIGLSSITFNRGN